jgi:hypothetical protein
MLVQFMPEARPLIAMPAAVLLTLLVEPPMLVTVLVAIISFISVVFRFSGLISAGAF